MTEDTGSDGAMRVDPELVRQLAQMLNDNDLSEIEVEDGDRRIAVKRNLIAAPAAEPTGPHPGTIPSPMVGTVYLSAEPGSKPFVSAGESVAEGDTLLIIEAMKVMNQITAPRSGTVTRILVQNAEPVEFGQPLVVIE